MGRGGSRSSVAGRPVRGRRRWDDVIGATAMVLALSVVWQPTESAVEDGSASLRVVLWLLLAALVAWRRRGSVTLRHLAADRPLLLFVTGLCGLVGWLAVAGMVMGPLGHRRVAANAVWLWVGMAASWGTLRVVLADVWRRQVVLVAGVAVAAGVAGYGIYDWAVIQPETRRMYESDREGVLRAQGIDPSEGNPQRKQFEDRLYSTEPLGSFGLPNSLAGFLASWIVVAAGLGMQSLDRDRRGAAWSVSLGASLALMLFCLVLTKSRTAYLASGIGLAGLLVSFGLRGRTWRRAVWLAGTGLLVLLAAGIVWLVLRDPLVLSQAPLSVKYRWEYWSASLALVADHPWFGCGPGNFQAFYTRYMAPWSSETIADPHNFLVEVLATGGIPAGLCLVLVIGAWFWSSGRPSRWGEGIGGRSDAPHGGRSPWLLMCGVVVFAATVGGRWDGGSDGAGLWLALNMPLFLLVGLLGLAIAWGASGCASGEGEFGGQALDRRVIGWGLVAWGINASAAGGLTFWSVSQTAWLLLALWWASPEPAFGSASGRSTAGGAQRSARRIGGGLAGAAFLLAAVACWTGAVPVWRAGRAMAAAVVARDRAAAQRWLRRAAAADDWWSEPWKGLAALEFEAAMGGGAGSVEGGGQGGDALVEVVGEALARERASAPLYAQAGDWYGALWDRWGDRKWAKRAVAMYGRAVECHPSNAFYHAQLAWYLEQMHEQAAAQAAARALELDAQMPDPNLRLGRRRLREGSRWGTVSAERRMLEIRNQSDAVNRSSGRRTPGAG